MQNNQVKTIEELITLSSVDGGADFFIHLTGGMRSSKHITYDAEDKTFHIFNYIDDTEQTLTAAELYNVDKSNIGGAMTVGALYFNP